MTENEKKNAAEEKQPTFTQRSGLRELFELFSLTGFVYGPLDSRLDIKDALEKNLKKPVPPHVVRYVIRSFVIRSVSLRTERLRCAERVFRPRLPLFL